MNKHIAISGICSPCFCLPLFFLSMIMLVSLGCVTTPPEKTDAKPASNQSGPPPAEPGRLKSDHVILKIIPTDSFESLERALPANNGTKQENKSNPGINDPDGFQVIPLLVYHRIGPGKSAGENSISEDTFNRQIAYLKNNGYNVLSMKRFLASMEYRLNSPGRSVLITIDDDRKTTRNIVRPILKKYGYSASLLIDQETGKGRLEPFRKTQKIFASSMPATASAVTLREKGSKDSVNRKGNVEHGPLPRFAFLKVRTTPHGASVFVNGVQKGSSPLALKLGLGKYRVKLSHSGYRDLECLIILDRMSDFPLNEKLRPVEWN